LLANPRQSIISTLERISATHRLCLSGFSPDHDYIAGSSAIRSCSADCELRIGERLLTATSEPEAELSSHLAEVIAEGKRARDESKFKRFRLVVQTENAAEEREKLLRAFEAVPNKDERTHMHVLECGEAPSLV